MVLAILGATSASRAVTAEPKTAAPPPAIEKPAGFKLVDGAPSIDVLVARVLDALAANDARALHRLRVTEDEYRRFVIPGSAKPGQPPQVLDEKQSAFWWGMLNTNSRYAGERIMVGYGGHHYTLKGVEYAKGHTQLLWYDAYKTTVLTLENDDGEERELTLGSIAHVDGQYKFISLLGNR